MCWMILHSNLVLRLLNIARSSWKPCSWNVNANTAMEAIIVDRITMRENPCKDFNRMFVVTLSSERHANFTMSSKILTMSMYEMTLTEFLYRKWSIFIAGKVIPLRVYQECECGWGIAEILFVYRCIFFSVFIYTVVILGGYLLIYASNFLVDDKWQAIFFTGLS